MKKIISIIFAIIITVTMLPTTALAKEQVTIKIDNNAQTTQLSNKLYGLSIDDINFACDGGLSAQMLGNNSFECDDISWQKNGIDLSVEISQDSQNDNNPSFAVVEAKGKGTLSNSGASNSISFKEGESYDFSCYIKNRSFDGTVSVYLNSSKNKVNVTQLDISNTNGLWTKIDTTLSAEATESGELTIEFDGSGSICLDSVSLTPQNEYGYHNDSWKYVNLRSDVVTAIEQLNPDFIAFSCVDIYEWKNTIGSLEQRTQYSTEDNSGVTLGIGYHEFFQLCSDLNTSAVPVAKIGDLTQGAQDWSNYLQNVFDIIEYANGSATTTYLGALRSANGSEQPFNIKYIGVVDESDSADFESNLKAFTTEINKTYPEIQLITLPSTENSTSNLLGAVDEASNIVDFEQNQSSVYCQSLNNNFIDFSSNELVLTPSYYAQMLFANSGGSAVVSLETEDNSISKSVTIDKNNGVIYVKLANSSGKSVSVNLELSDFDNIRSAVIQSIGSSYKGIANDFGKNVIAPVEEELEASGNSLSVSLDKYEVAVVQISCSSDSDSTLYKLPEAIETVASPTSYVPTMAKIVIPVAIAVVIIFVVLLVVSKKSKRVKGEQ